MQSKKKEFKSQKPKSRNSKKKELKTANKTSNGIERFIHDISTECMIYPLSG